MHLPNLKGDSYKSDKSFYAKGGNMKSKVKAFIAVIGVLLVVTAGSLILMSKGPLYGQAFA